jgi:membrane protease YdiL (CAAX protease family)
MMTRVAALEGRRRVIVPVPFLSPGLSSRWLSLVTDVDARTGRSLVDSMTNEVIVRDDSIRDLIPFEPMGYDDAVRAALAERRGTAPVTNALVRRRRVVAGTALAGAGLLGVSLSTPPGSRKFYALTLGVAGIWTVGGWQSGPLPLGEVRREVAVPVAIGGAAFGAFYGAALVARRIPPLRRALTDVMQYAHQGSDRLVLTTTLANGVAEEIFFRGAVYAAAAGRQPVARTTAAYTLATTTTRNPALVIASAVMGTLFGLQRRSTGGIQAPVLTHVTWSTLMLRFVPPLFRSSAH